MTRPLPDNWDELRRKVYSRDDYKCQKCGGEGGPHGNTELHAHHITPRSKGGSDDMNNLVTLCDTCHNNQHAHDIKGSDPTAKSNNSFPKTGLIAISISILCGATALLFPNLIFNIFGSILGFIMFPIVIIVSFITGVYGVTALLTSL